jgi:DUF917 family protein
MHSLSVDELDDLALGAVMLATGGGGDPHLPALIARQTLLEHGSVALISPAELDDDAFVVPVGSVGAPTVSLELLPSVDEAAAAIRAFEEYVGRKADAIACFEVGGGNSLVPLAAAAACGVPLVDGDGMGRAFPEAQMMSFAIDGVAPTPAVALDYAGNTAIFNTESTAVYEHHIRAFAAAAGGMITTAEHAMSGKQARRSMIPDTVSFCVTLGRVIRQHRGSADALLKPLREAFADSVYGECRHLFSGKVVDKSTRIVGGYDVGEAIIEHFVHPEQRLNVAIKNEFLIAQSNEQILATVPDLITIVDHDTSEPINCERLRYGQRVAVFAIGCPAYFRTAPALAVTAPRCFGFDLDYVPLESLPALAQPLG